MTNGLYDGTCDICGKTDVKITGVFSSGLGAISFANCILCGSFRAEPQAVCEGILSKDPKETCDAIYYDNGTDVYKSYQTGKIVQVETFAGEMLTSRRSMVLSVNDAYTKGSTLVFKTAKLVAV